MKRQIDGKQIFKEKTDLNFANVCFDMYRHSKNLYRKQLNIILLSFYRKQSSFKDSPHKLNQSWE